MSAGPDEAAAQDVGDRHLAAVSIARAALATSDHDGGALASALSGGAVAERVEALLVPARPSRWRVARVPVAVAALSAASVLAATRDLEQFFDLAR